MIVDYSTQPIIKTPDDELVFHLEAPQNVILKVFPYLDDGSIHELLNAWDHAQGYRFFR
jgi:hypothetical protein